MDMVIVTVKEAAGSGDICSTGAGKPWIGFWRRSGESEGVEMFGATVKDLEGRQAPR